MWESTKSRKEYFASINHRFLEQTWIQFNELFWNSIDDGTGDNNPTSYIRKIKEISQSLSNSIFMVHKILCSNRSGPECLLISPARSIIKFKYTIQSYFAWFNEFNFLSSLGKNTYGPNTLIPVNLNIKCEDIFDSSRLFGYLTGKAEVPVIIDTGASITLTQIINYVWETYSLLAWILYKVYLQKKICDQGTVNWKIQDVFQIVRVISTKAYYVPAATIQKKMTP